MAHIHVLPTAPAAVPAAAVAHVPPVPHVPPPPNLSGQLGSAYAAGDSPGRSGSLSGAPPAPAYPAGDDDADGRAVALTRLATIERLEEGAFYREGEFRHAWLTLDNASIEILRDAFYRIDAAKNGNGTLDYFELQTLWAGVFPDMKPEEVSRTTEHIFMDIDQDGSEEISFDELVFYLRGAPAQYEEFEDLMEEAASLPKPTKAREWVWALLEPSCGDRYASAAIRRATLCISLFVQAVILLSIITMILQTMPAYTSCDGGDDGQQPKACQGDPGTPTTFAIESFCIAVFSLEFIARLASTPALCRFWTDGFTWIDLLSVVPFYLDLFGVGGGAGESLPVLRVLRLLRLVRVLRVAKLGKNAAGVHLMACAMGRARIALCWALMLVIMADVAFASLLWFVEKDQAEFHPDGSTHCSGRGRSTSTCGVWIRNETSEYVDHGKEIAFQSIPDAMWWAMVTLTTVGYGDQYVVTHAGKGVAALTMATGLLVVSYPVTILSANFADVQKEFEEAKKKRQRRLALSKKIQADRKAAEKAAKTALSLPLEDNLAALAALSQKTPRLEDTAVDVPGLAATSPSPHHRPITNKRSTCGDHQSPLRLPDQSPRGDGSLNGRPRSPNMASSGIVPRSPSMLGHSTSGRAPPRSPTGGALARPSSGAPRPMSASMPSASASSGTPRALSQPRRPSAGGPRASPQTAPAVPLDQAKFAPAGQSITSMSSVRGLADAGRMGSMADKLGGSMRENRIMRMERVEQMVQSLPRLEQQMGDMLGLLRGMDSRLRRVETAGRGAANGGAAPVAAWGVERVRHAAEADAQVRDVASPHDTGGSTADVALLIEPKQVA